MPIEPGNLSLGVLAGGLIGIFAGHYLTKSRSEEDRVNKAATEFHCAFTSIIVTLSDLERGDNDSAIMEPLLAKYVTQRNALVRFKIFLSESDRTKIENAWNDYCYDNDPNDGSKPEVSDRFKKYSLFRYCHSNPTEAFENMRQLALDNIDSLLSFAKTR